mgnify:CR=1 FL=1
MGKVMLEVRNLKTKYITRFHEDVYAVDGVSFTIEEGKSLGIAGAHLVEDVRLSIGGSVTRFAEVHPKDDAEVVEQIRSVVSSLAGASTSSAA